MKFIIARIGTPLTVSEAKVCYFCRHNWMDMEFDHHFDVFYQESEKSDEQFVGYACYPCANSQSRFVRNKWTERIDEGWERYETGRLHHQRLVGQVLNLRSVLEYLEQECRIVEDGLSEQKNDLELAESYAYNAEILTHNRSDLPDTSRHNYGNRNSAQKSRVNRPGYIYLLKAPTGHYKIGRTKDVPTRVNTLKIQLPFEVELIHSFFVTDYVRAEIEIHDAFSDMRTNGEWFSLTDEMVEQIKSQKDEPNGEEVILIGN